MTVPFTPTVNQEFQIMFPKTKGFLKVACYNNNNKGSVIFMKRGLDLMVNIFN